jgi:hypothetical protein
MTNHILRILLASPELAIASKKKPPLCEIMEQSTLLCKQADETKALSKNNLQPASQSTSFGD